MNGHWTLYTPILCWFPLPHHSLLLCFMCGHVVLRVVQKMIKSFDVAEVRERVARVSRIDEEKLRMETEKPRI